MEFRILGPVEVVDAGRALPLGGAKQRALLAALLLERNRVVPAERLIDALWDEAPTETAAKALQVYVSQLRKLLGPGRVETKAPGYRLRVDAGELDLERFEQLRAAGDAKAALSLWRGPPLSDVADRRFARVEAGRLEELRLASLEDRIDEDLAAGRHAAVVAELETLVREQPFRERLRGQLMLALYRSGRQAEALEAYQKARAALVEELGIEPGKPLRDLHQAILRQDPALDLRAAVAEAPHREAPPAAPFVGRERELAQSRQALDEALAGRGRLLLISGEPGIGKSRLLDEVARVATSRGATVLEGRCWEAGGAPPYWPWTHALRAYVRSCEPRVLRAQLGSGAAEVAQVVPDVARVLPGLEEPTPSDSESARFRLFQAVGEFLERASDAQPLVLVFDDLHAADAPSLLLLRFVANELERMRLLISCAYRDLDPTVPDELAATVTDVSRFDPTIRLSLSGLSEPEVRQMVAVAGGKAAPTSVSETLHVSTEGNPLFVGEMVRLLVAEGRLEDPAPRLAVPDSVRDVIDRRLRHLSSECRRVLTLASILGREFGLVALERVADYTGIDKLLEVLDEAIRARVVTEVPEALGRLRFAHALIRDTLYLDVAATQRVRLHRRVLEVLDELYRSDAEPHLTELAHHAVAAVPAVDEATAAGLARRAGDRALALLAYEEAARLYRAALDVVGSGHDRLRCELLLSLGDAEIRAGDRAAAREAFVSAAEIARRLGLPRELALAALGYGGRIVWGRAGDDVRLVPLLEEALAGLPDEEIELRARLLARLAGALRDEPSRDRRDRLSQEAVELARAGGDPGALAYALDGRAHAILAPDTVTDVLALGAELRELGAAVGDGERVMAGHVARSIAQDMLGDVGAAETELAAAARIADELGQPAQLWQVAGDKAMIALATGRLAEAEALVERAFAFGERAQRAAESVYRLQLYTLAEFRGTLAEVEPSIADLVARYPARPVFRCVQTHLHARLGRLAAADRELADLSRDGFSAVPFDWEWLFGMSFLAEVAAVLGSTGSAATLYRLLLPWRAFNAADVAEGMRGSVSRYLGLLAATLDRLDDARSHFEDALAANERMGLRPWLAYTQYDYARLLETRDPARARELRDQAFATFDELGMTPPPERS